MNKQIDKYLEQALKVILPIIFLLPFVVDSDFYFPFVTPRNFAFRIIISLALAIYLFLYFRNKDRFALIKSKILISYLALALIMTISSFINGDFLYSFWSNYERMEGLLGLYYLIALLVIILGVYRRKKAWLSLIRVSVWASLLMSIVALSQHWGVNLFIESSGGERVTGTTGNAIYLAVYALFNLCFALYLIFKNKNRKPKLELWLFYILDTLLIIVEVFGSGKGILVGVLSDIRIFLLFIIPQIFINLQYYFYNIKKTIKYSWAAYFILIILLNFIALFNTQTRGVLVGMFVASIVVSIFLLFSRYVNRKFKSIILGVLLLVMLLGSSIFYFKESSFIRSNSTLNRIASISISDTTSETRLLTWQLSLRSFTEKPILGWGEEKFYIVFNKYFPNEIFKGSGSRVWFDRPHNVFLQQLVHGGILGLLSYLAIFWFAMRNLWRHYRNTHDLITISILGGLLIAYLVQNFFVFDSLNSYIPMILLLAISVFLAGESESVSFISKIKHVFNKVKLPFANKNNALAICASLLVLVLGFSLNISQMMTNRNFITQYNDLRQSIGRGDYQREDTDRLLEIINTQYFGKFELRQVYAEFVPSLIKAKILSPVETKYFIDTAETEMFASIAEQVTNVRHHSFLANLYLQSNILDPIYSQKGIYLIEDEAIPLSPTRIQLYYSLGQFYINLGQSEAAISNFIKGRDLAPDVFDSYYNLFVTYMSLENPEAANQTLVDMEENVNKILANDYIRLSGVYKYFKMEDKATDLINKAIEINKIK